MAPTGVELGHVTRKAHTLNRGRHAVIQGADGLAIAVLAIVGPVAVVDTEVVATAAHLTADRGNKS